MKTLFRAALGARAKLGDVLFIVGTISYETRLKWAVDHMLGELS